ncbi:ABC transporter ATP-binding protein [Flavobacterium subsaxonicum]|uniref:Antibiotic ABC transporter ATP-binding protein n=1 Tax=Flavobacterium subsaxonicum WB 4.1-42 = DSM 21790 TaxID=1121898 RepID=A0A0A2MXE3_9FLAO|nr:ABC transporter ATP-binding protein [Flavobacterium subsaxonicum]KGO92895.1 antibiotic ABC transporter ATP-binding protein [Flavobacterium subsaxonicum WB 4.1-42 = DSM 21790]
MSDYKKIARLALPYKKYIFLNIFFNVLSAFFSTLSLIAVIPVLNVIFENTKPIIHQPVYHGIGDLKTYLQDLLNHTLYVQILEQGVFTVLMYIIGLIIIIFMLKNLTTYLAVYFITYLRNGLIRDIREAMYAKIVKLPASYYSATTKGDVITRLTTDVNEISNSLQNILEMVVKEPLTILFTLGVMTALSLKLTLFVFIFIPIAGFLVSKIGKSLKKKSMLLQREQGEVLSVLEETISGLKIIKSFTAEAIFGKKFNITSNRLFDHSNAVANRQNLASPMSEFLGIVIIAVLLVYGGYLVFEDKSMEADFFLGYILMAYNILTPAKDISKASYGLKRGTASAERIVQILEAPVAIDDHAKAIEKDTFEKGISINNINFYYKDEKYVLTDFSVSVPKGQTVALVGQSGSGKSTIANLLTRFYDVQEGSIKIDGIDIRDIKLKSLRGMIGLVTQDSILFNDSVRNNMLVGRHDATDEQIFDALKVANAYEFVVGHSEGLDYNIGDGGNNLSGGQKQRLSIARAVLKNPPIMILDEATSALDTESERLVQQALDNMMQNRTSVVIAHRLSTIQKADKIVVMQKGRIVEQGTHDELIAQEGTYKKLVMMQSFE